METLIEREFHYNGEQMNNAMQKRKIAIFCCGVQGRHFRRWLEGEGGMHAEFFIDNAPRLDGTLVEGKMCVREPWRNSPSFADDYFVIIATNAGGNKYYKQIAKQLQAVGIPHISSDAVRLYFLNTHTEFWARCRQICSLLDGDASKLSFLGSLYYLLTYDSSFVVSSEHQYFAVKPFMSPEFEFICDAGAYVGDTVEEYIRRGAGNLTITAFEPHAPSKTALDLRAARLKTEWNLADGVIVTEMAALGGRSGKTGFEIAPMPHASSLTDMKSSVMVDVYSIDDYFKDKTPTVIKADVEGTELDLLRGAANTIRQYAPKLAICIYHRPEDFVEIPEYILSLNKSYNMAVRTHSNSHTETVLYCYV